MPTLLYKMYCRFVVRMVIVHKVRKTHMKLLWCLENLPLLLIVPDTSINND